MSVTSIKFHAVVLGNTVERLYQLGVGPCGKKVSRLQVNTRGGSLLITQTCSDGEVKYFAYPWHIVVSKVTITTH